MVNRYSNPWGAGQIHHVVAAAFAFFVVLAFGISTSFAQKGPGNGQSAPESSAAARMRALSNSLLGLHGQMQQGVRSEAAGVRSEAATVIAERAAALSALIEEDPRAALSFAFSSELLADLAAKFPGSASLLESQGTWQGTVEVWVTDYAKPAHSKTTVLMKAGVQKLELHFAAGLPSNLKSGEVVQATGVVVGHDMAVSTSSTVQSGAALIPDPHPTSGFFVRVQSSLREVPRPVFVLFFGMIALTPFVRVADFRRAHVRALAFVRNSALYVTVLALVVSPSVASAQSCSTTGAQNIIVLLVTFPGVALPSNLTTSYLQTMSFSATGPSINNYWQEASYGRASAAGDVYGPFTLTGNYSGCNSFQIENDAIAAAISAGANLNNYSRVLVVFPDVLGCGWGGLGQVGCSATTFSSGTFTIGSAFVVAAAAASSQTTGGFIELGTHELGHTLGLRHARGRDFGTLALGALGVTGTLEEYGNGFSAMGSDTPGHYAAGHKADILNWLVANTDYQAVTTSGTYTIQPYEQASGIKALKVQRGTGNSGNYLWIEYRQPIGLYDTTFLSTQPYSGALINYEDSVTGAQTDLLDFTPDSNPTDDYSDFKDAALVAGQTWTDPYTNLSMSVVSATGSALTLTITYGGTIPCTSAAPSVSISPLNPSIYPGQSASYSVSVTNNDSSGCSSSTINLGSSEPAGWSTSLSSSSVTLSPGQSASVTLGKGAPTGTPAGTYAVDMSASSSASTGSATANVTVITPPTLAVTISVSGTSFTRPGTVPITASVTSGGAAASGASVTFTLTTPSGSTTTQTATTGTNGTATWNYKLNAKSAAGTYSVSAQAALSSGSGGKKGSTTGSTQTATSNTVSFTVQ